MRVSNIDRDKNKYRQKTTRPTAIKKKGSQTNLSGPISVADHQHSGLPAGKNIAPASEETKQEGRGVDC